MTTITGPTKQAKTRTAESTTCEPPIKVKTNEIAMTTTTTMKLTTKTKRTATTKMTTRNTIKISPVLDFFACGGPGFRPHTSPDPSEK